MTETKILQDIDSKLTTLVALTALNIASDPQAGSGKIEVVLHQCGLDYESIAKILNKKKDAVRMTIQRSK